MTSQRFQKLAEQIVKLTAHIQDSERDMQTCEVSDLDFFALITCIM